MRIFETDRLCLRNLEAADLDSIYDYRNSEECGRYQRWEDFTREALRAFIDRFREDVFLSEKEEQHYAVSLKGGTEPVGELAYFYTPGDCITLGITISYHHQKKGYAFELLTEVIRRIRGRYPSMDIAALIERENGGSIRLFEKLGFVRECYAEPVSSYVYVLYGR